MADFCSIADLEALLRVDISDADAIEAASKAIGWVTAAIKNYCHQQIELIDDDNISFDIWARTDRIVLPEVPVVAVSQVIEDDEVLTEDDDYIVAEDGILYRIGGSWRTGAQIVEVTYSHGYADIPSDIEAICARAAARIYQAGLLSAETNGVPGVASLQLGDYSVSYSLGQGSQGLLGVSAGWVLLPSEKRVLDRYRIRGA